MANSYVIGADNIDGKEHSYLNKVSSALKKKGHKVKLVGVGPNVVQSYALGSGSKGTICIQIAGGLDGWTAADMVTGLKQGYYHCDYMMIAGTSAFTGNSNLAKSAYTEKHMKRASDAGASLQGMYSGKTPQEFNDEYKKYFKFALGDSIDEMIEQILGESSKTDDDDKSNDSSNYMDMIKDLCSPWDGDVEIKLDFNKCYINKIPPQNEHLWLKEGVNVVSGSLNITDYNPITYNKMIVTYADKEIVFEDPYLIDRFGENPITLPAVETVTTYSTDTEDNSNEDSTDDDSSSDTNSETDTADNDKTTSKTEEIPITDPEKAMQFAEREWGKIRRGDGHTVEVQVLGSNEYKVGRWCQVYVPRFQENVDMYITKIDNNVSSNDEWTTTLTLQDYAPSLKNDTDTDNTNNEDSTDDDSDSDSDSDSDDSGDD